MAQPNEAAPQKRKKSPSPARQKPDWNKQFLEAVQAHDWPAVRVFLNERARGTEKPDIFGILEADPHALQDLPPAEFALMYSGLVQYMPFGFYTTESGRLFVLRAREILEDRHSEPDAIAAALGTLSSDGLEILGKETWMRCVARGLLSRLIPIRFEAEGCLDCARETQHLTDREIVEMLIDAAGVWPGVLHGGGFSDSTNKVWKQFESKLRAGTKAAK